jgi:hypothetical protein
MRTILLIIFIIAITIFIAGCLNIEGTEKTIEVVVIRDVTDSMKVIPKSDEIVPQFGLDREMWDGGIFRLVDLTDVSYNHTYEASLSIENPLLTNSFKRRDKVKKFYSEISKVISDASQEKIGKDNSSIYFSIAKELNKLSQSSSDKKIMLVYSDLIENTEQMSFYDPKIFDLLDKNTDQIKEYFESQMELKNLNGIKIYLIYQPLNMMDDVVHKWVTKLYKTILESKGATVEITANIN